MPLVHRTSAETGAPFGGNAFSDFVSAYAAELSIVTYTTASFWWTSVCVRSLSAGAFTTSFPRTTRYTSVCSLAPESPASRWVPQVVCSLVTVQTLSGDSRLLQRTLSSPATLLLHERDFNLIARCRTQANSRGCAELIPSSDKRADDSTVTEEAYDYRPSDRPARDRGHASPAIARPVRSPACRYRQFPRGTIQSRTQATLLCATKFSDDCGDSMM